MIAARFVLPALRHGGAGFGLQRAHDQPLDRGRDSP
jgi:hypothetical protein